MRIVALNGSPRKSGNTDCLIDELFRGAGEATAGASCEKIYLDDYRIEPVGELADVQQERTDERADDDHRLILNRVLDADALVIGSPVYWQGLTGQMKCFVDRFSCHYAHDWFNEGMSGKGWVALTAFGNPDISEGRWVIEPVKVWAGHFDGQYIGDVAVSAFRKGAVADDADAMHQAFELGRKVVETMAETDD